MFFNAALAPGVHVEVEGDYEETVVWGVFSFTAIHVVVLCRVIVVDLFCFFIFEVLVGGDFLRRLRFCAGFYGFAGCFSDFQRRQNVDHQPTTSAASSKCHHLFIQRRIVL